MLGFIHIGVVLASLGAGLPHCGPDDDSLTALINSVETSLNLANLPDGPPAGGGLDTIPTDLIAFGRTDYVAFVGVSWVLSKKWGEGYTRRTKDEVVISTALGSVTLVASGEDIVATMSDGTVLRGEIVPTDDGVKFEATSGEVVEITKDRKRIVVDFRGVNALVNSLGVYLKRA